jgi:hypothetical protein
MRQTFVEWAAQTINKSYWAGIYYQQQRDKGSTYQAAVRSLAFKWIRILYRCWQTGVAYDESRYLKVFKWIRILYRCWQTGVAYDESRYLKVLERRGSPLVTRQKMTESA